MILRYKNHLILHATVLIFGLTGPIGKAIEASEAAVVFYRLIFAILGVYIYFRWTNFNFDFSTKSIKKYGYVGLIVGLHWITFFGAIKASNVSVALICFSSSTLFTAIIEAIYSKRNIVLYEILLGIGILIGIYFLCKEPGKSIFESHYKVGIGLSIFSAALASWFTVINGTLVKKGHDAKNISFIQLIFALLLVLIYVPLFNGAASFTVLKISWFDLFLTAILGILCTSIAYILSVKVMQELSAYTVTMAVNLEPVYAIVLAVLLWPNTEKMQPTFYIGTAAILGVIFLNGILKSNANKKKLLLK